MDQSGMSFRQRLEARWSDGLFVCVGLDPELSKIPACVHPQGDSVEHKFTKFLTGIVGATSDVVCCYKINLAFFLRHGLEGMQALQQIVFYIQQSAPDVPIILDFKSGDIGNSSEGYADFAFDHLKVDAVTVNPYMGEKALEPFLRRGDKGVFVLCRTSNHGAGEFQDLHVQIGIDELEHLHKVDCQNWSKGVNGARATQFLHVAYQVSTEWNKLGNCGLVAGGTQASELADIRRVAGDLPLLIPGIGAQGGDVADVVPVAKDSVNRGMIINASRSIIYAPNGGDFADAARTETKRLSSQINAYLRA